LMHGGDLSYFSRSENLKSYFQDQRLVNGDAFAFGKLEDFMRYATREILEGVKFLHDNGIAHLDMKGANVMLDSPPKKYPLDEFPQIKIADFNTAIRYQSDKKINGVVGTYTHMTPEMLKGRSSSPAQNDLWGVGCIALEILNGVQNSYNVLPWNYGARRMEDFGTKLNLSLKIMQYLKNVSADELTDEHINRISQFYDVTYAEILFAHRFVKLSAEFRDFITTIMSHNPDSRFSSAEKALDHPWIKGETLTKTIPVTSLPKLEIVQQPLQIVV